MDWKKVTTSVLFAVVSAAAFAQAPPFSTGFRAPMELALTRGGNLLVVEAGNGPNTGRLSLVDRATGARRTLIDALPSGIHAGAQPSPSGPSGVALQGNSIYLVIGNGDSVEAGPLPRTEVPSENPSSPIFSSVLEMRPSLPLDAMTGGFVLDGAHQAAIDAGEPVVLTNAQGEHLTIRLVVDFPDYTPEPRPDFAENVRLSNTFGIVALGQALFVVDSSQNLVYQVDARAGTYRVLSRFGNLSNPNPAMGGPFVEPVPTAARIRGNDLLVTTLTGFPFPPGSAEIHTVSMITGATEGLIQGLSSAIDLVPLGNAPGAPIAVLEFSTNQLTGVPGRLSIVSPSAGRTVLAEGLITPTGLAVDLHTGEIFVAHLGPGIVTRIDASASITTAAAPASIPVVGTVQGAFGSRFATALQIVNPFSYPIAGRLVFRPAGSPASPSDPSITYALAPFESRNIGDLGAELGVSGIGAVDVVAAPGQVPELITAISGRGSAAAAAVQVPRVGAADVLHAGMRGVIAAPADPARTRLNIGVRTFDAPAEIAVLRFDQSGTLVESLTRTFSAATFIQLSAADLLGGEPTAGEVLGFEILSGAALIYASRTENDGSGIVMQIARPVPQ